MWLPLWFHMVICKQRYFTAECNQHNVTQCLQGIWENQHFWDKKEDRDWAQVMIDHICQRIARNIYLIASVLLFISLQWRHDDYDGVSIHQPHDCLLNHLFRHRSKKTHSSASLAFVRPVTGEFPVIGEVPAQRASNAENVSIWWRLMLA